MAVHDWPTGGSTLLSWIAHPGGIKHALESVQHGVVLEELIDQGTQRSGGGPADVRLERHLVPRCFWYHGVRKESRRKR